MCIFKKEYIRLNVCFTFKVLLLVGSEQKPTVRKASSKDEDGNDTEQMCFTFPKCFSLLDKNKTEQIELIMFCDFTDAGDIQIGSTMMPASAHLRRTKMEEHRQQETRSYRSRILRDYSVDHHI